MGSQTVVVVGGSCTEVRGCKSRVDVLLLQGSGSWCGAAVCPACGKAFQGRNRRQNLAHHVLTHTGARPFSCSHCPYRATQKAHLKRHLERRHGQSGEGLQSALNCGTPQTPPHHHHHHHLPPDSTNPPPSPPPPPHQASSEDQLHQMFTSSL